MLYNQIYINANKLPGYCRYVDFSEAIKSVTKPFEWLASAEDTYWGVFKSLGNQGNGRRVLEVGSGYGYLTYALVKAGFQARGLDLSVVAVEQARLHFGDFYEVGEISDVASSRPASYDIVLFTEVIEHLVNPHEFIAAARKLLVTGGKLVLTTPNRSVYSDDILWETDLPPVHLWWFTERSIEVLAQANGCDVTFVNFSSCKIGQIPRIKNKNLEITPTRDHILDSNGFPRYKVSPKFVRKFLIWLRRYSWIYRIELLIRRKSICSGPHRPVLCAILEPIE